MLGKLEKVDLRSVWKNEAKDFTNWLAEEANLSLLSDEIGIELKLVQTEAKAEEFNVDILAEEENTGRKVIIENQLESTDHDHLGKLITYASAHDAEIIVWIVKEVREAHRQAIDWLNEHTDEEINFFIVQIELWKICGSPCAPKFQIISKPNYWAKTVKKSIQQSEMTDTKLKQLEFWSKFREYAEDNGAKFRLRKPLAHQWYDISYGSSQSHISLNVNKRENLISCDIYIPDSKELYQNFFKHKAEIEKEVGELEWMELPEKKASRIRLAKSVDIDDESKWEEYFEWLKSMAETFQSVFSKYIKSKQS